MATISAYTTIDQSRKLSEILPLESADMLWEQHGAEPYVTMKPWTTIGKSIGCHCLGCWSLAALLGVLDFPSLTQRNENEWEVCIFDHDNDGYIEKIASNPVDACYEMILKLHELKML